MLLRTTVKTLCLSALLTGFFSASCKKDKAPAKPVTSYDFSYKGNLLANDTLYFTSTAPSGSSFLWQFGDGATSASATPVHVYTAAGSYTVALVVSGDTAHAIRHTAMVTADTIYDFNYSGSRYAGGALYFFTTVVSGHKFLWNFGDGSSSSAAVPAHTFTAAGRYTVSLTVDNDTTHTISEKIAIGTDSAMMERLTGSRAYFYTAHLSSATGDTTYSFTVSKTISLVDPITLRFDNGDNLYLRSSASDILFFTYSTDNGSYPVSSYIHDTLIYNNTGNKIDLKIIVHNKNVNSEEHYVSL